MYILNTPGWGGEKRKSILIKHENIEGRVGGFVLKPHKHFVGSPSWPGRSSLGCYTCQILTTNLNLFLKTCTTLKNNIEPKLYKGASLPNLNVPCSAFIGQENRQPHHWCLQALTILPRRTTLNNYNDFLPAVQNQPEETLREVVLILMTPMEQSLQLIKLISQLF